MNLGSVKNMIDPFKNVCDENDPDQLEVVEEKIKSSIGKMKGVCNTPAICNEWLSNIEYAIGNESWSFYKMKPINFVNPS